MGIIGKQTISLFPILEDSGIKNKNGEQCERKKNIFLVFFSFQKGKMMYVSM